MKRLILATLVAMATITGTAQAITQAQAADRANSFLIASLGPAVGPTPMQMFNCEPRANGAWSCGFRIRVQGYCYRPWRWYVGAIWVNRRGYGRHFQSRGCELPI